MAMIVYYKLVNRFNRRGWPELLACSNQRMMLACRIKDEETYIKHRNLLKQYGFIDFTSGKKGSPTKYSLKINTGLNRGISPSEMPSVLPSELPSETPEPKRKALIHKTKKRVCTPKVCYAERVYMTEPEHEKLIAEFGTDAVDWMINKLDTWKGANGKPAKDRGSDYLKIRNWVVKAYEEDAQKKGTSRQQSRAANIVKLAKADCPNCHGTGKVKLKDEFTGQNIEYTCDCCKIDQ
ncbi:hypothetical protein Ga0466249_004811 [Sporomusaceae bacterium BoRhaA]|uniref:hypothetical protein n=1 Tax=Pelorhabdus rhamnosifermentans TaxID=2772457 RepID=UPI001C062F6B|nr:hypothetical protein [Pelorhabdus rhamnosifermentans]MBU2703663.1 hypothetical protein [Pelorhabdus rhamnosifermentans]